MMAAFEKGEKLRFIGHLDLMRTMQRALRRSHLPIKYSNGFNPHIRLSFAAPLSVGVAGKREMMEVPVEDGTAPEEFISKLNRMTGKTFRLPTEAEWEYAARGGNKSKGYQYSGSNNLSDVAWYRDNSGYKTYAVGTKQPNELGIYDMSGNVWEWCQDWYGEYSSSSQVNPTGANSGSSRVNRGGAVGNDARLCRSSCRANDVPGTHYSILGLRLSLSE